MLCRASPVYSEAGPDYSSTLAFKVSFNNTASLAGVKSTRPPNTHCQILFLCQIIPVCLCTLFAIKNIKQGPCVVSRLLFVCICDCLSAWVLCAQWVHTNT